MQGLWADAMPILLIISTIGTTLLMARFLTLMAAERPRSPCANLWTAATWVLLLGVLLFLPFLTGFPFPPLASSWPLAVGVFVALLVTLGRPTWSRRLLGSVPAGDVLGPALRATRRLRLLLGGFGTRALARRTKIRTWKPRGASWARLPWRIQPEQALDAWPAAGAVFLGIGATLFILLWTL